MSPTLSIVIVSYHSRDDLERCLPTIERQDFDDYEIIVADNAPGDGTAAWLAQEYAKVRVLTNEKNTGYAGGNNRGIDAAAGTYTMILNPDTELHDGALHELMRVATEHPDALVTPKLLQPDGTVNACGNVMHPTGITVCRGLGEPSERYTGVHQVQLVSGACFVARTALLRDLGGFDEDYFMYMEDADLSLRAKGRGAAILCAASAVVDHHYALAMSPGKLLYLERNRLVTLLKNYERRTIWRLMPALWLVGIATWLFALSRGPGYCRARLQVVPRVWQSREAWRAKRRAIQRTRLYSDAVLLNGAPRSLPTDQVLSSGWLRRVVRVITRTAHTEALVSDQAGSRV